MEKIDYYEPEDDGLLLILEMQREHENKSVEPTIEQVRLFTKNLLAMGGVPWRK